MCQTVVPVISDHVIFESGVIIENAEKIIRSGERANELTCTKGILQVRGVHLATFEKGLIANRREVFEVSFPRY